MKFSAYWRCQLGGWFLFIAIQTGISLMVGQFKFKFLAYLISMALIGVCITHGMRQLIHRHQLKQWSLRRLIFTSALTVPVLTAIMTSLTFAISRSMELMQLKDDVPLLFMVMQVSINWALVFIIWLTIYFSVSFFKRYQQTEIEKWKMKALLNDTALQALRTQINPHFMFNCLTSACALTVEDPPKAQKVLTQLSDLLRHALSTSEQSIVSVEQELSITRKYLELEAIRLEDRLKYSIDVGEESRQARMPAMMMQMLVENGIKHGVATRPQGGRLEIKADLSQDHLHLQIANTGHLGGETKPGHGLGLHNVVERLQLLYGDRASFSLSQEGEDWVVADVQVPLENTA